MPRIDIHHPHQLPVAEARAVVDRVAARMREKFGTDDRWQGDTLAGGSAPAGDARPEPACRIAAIGT